MSNETFLWMVAPVCDTFTRRDELTPLLSKNASGSSLLVWLPEEPFHSHFPTEFFFHRAFVPETDTETVESLKSAKNIFPPRRKRSRLYPFISSDLYHEVLCVQYPSGTRLRQLYGLQIEYKYIEARWQQQLTTKLYRV